MEVLKDILKWAVYSAPLIISLSWVWIALSFHRFVRDTQKGGRRAK